MLIGRKVGMTRVVVGGEMVPVTVIQVGPCYVLGLRTPERDGYTAIRVAFGKKKAKRIKRPLLGELVKVFGEGKEYYPAEKIKEFRVPSLEGFEPGKELTLRDLIPSIPEDAEGFVPVEGVRVDVTGRTKGRGFAGVMKRWDFSGGPAAHGSKFHRRPGSIGQHSEPAKIWKGKKMAGHYGNEKLTVTNLKVVGVIPEHSLLLVKGAVPGPRGGIVYVRRAKRDVAVAS